MDNREEAFVKIDVPEYQIGELVNLYFKDSMFAIGICQSASKHDFITEIEFLKTSIARSRQTEHTYQQWNTGYTI